MTPLVSRAPVRILQVLTAALIMLALIAAPAVAQQSELDATERRITDLYSKSVDQLGSDRSA